MASLGELIRCLIAPGATLQYPHKGQAIQTKELKMIDVLWGTFFNFLVFGLIIESVYRLWIMRANTAEDRAARITEKHEVWSKRGRWVLLAFIFFVLLAGYMGLI